MTKLTTCIKNIEEDSWRLFKSEAAKHDMQLGDFFSKVVEDHTTRERGNNWDIILNKKRTLTKNQVKGLKKYTKEFRRGFKFRNASS